MLFTSCGGGLPGADARKYPPQPEKRVAKNLEEGKGFRLMDAMNKGGNGNFDFASSNDINNFFSKSINMCLNCMSFDI